MASDEEGDFFALGDRPKAAPQGLFPLGEAKLALRESRATIYLMVFDRSKKRRLTKYHGKLCRDQRFERFHARAGENSVWRKLR